MIKGGSFVILDSKLRELVQAARENSLFYRKIYKNIPLVINDISDIPIINPTEFWRATFDRNPVDGVVFRSQDNLGKSHYSTYSKQEWSLMTRIFARGLAAGPLKRGDRVANLFDSVQLNGDFLLLSESLHRSAIEALHFPLTGSIKNAEMIEYLKKFQINVLAGPLSTLNRFASYCLRMGATEKTLGCSIEQILFGSELFDEKKTDPLCALFPNAMIHSIGYANPQIGLIGYSDSSCSTREYRIFSEATWIELIDPVSLEPIHEAGQPGRLLTTQLFRNWTPVIRYPTGEWAEWVDAPHIHDRKFRRLGDSELGSKPRTRYPSQERFQSDSHYLRGAEQFAGK